MNGGAVVVDMSVELHVATSGHGVSLEDLLYSSPQVSPDLVQVIVLFDGLATGLCRSHSDSLSQLLHRRRDRLNKKISIFQVPYLVCF